MVFAVIRGEYPFDQVIGTAEAPEDQPEQALTQAIEQFKGHEDFFMRHPVVEPL